MRHRVGCTVVGFLSLVLSLAAQTASSGSASSQVPPLIQFSRVATDEGGSTLNGAVSITFSLFNNQRGGEPLWTEKQNVQLDSTGHYSVQLGTTKASGVPTTLFTSGEARWLAGSPSRQNNRGCCC
jgi:trimeric autotransporter adhesin